MCGPAIFTEALSLSSNNMNGSISRALKIFNESLVHLSLSNNAFIGELEDSPCHLINIGK